MTSFHFFAPPHTTCRSLLSGFCGFTAKWPSHTADVDQRPVLYDRPVRTPHGPRRWIRRVRGFLVGLTWLMSISSLRCSSRAVFTSFLAMPHKPQKVPPTPQLWTTDGEKFFSMCQKQLSSGFSGWRGSCGDAPVDIRCRSVF